MHGVPAFFGYTPLQGIKKTTFVEMSRIVQVRHIPRWHDSFGAPATPMDLERL